MAFNIDEMNQLKLIINEGIKPIHEMLILHEQTLHGEDIGLCKRTKLLEERVIDLRSFRRQIYTVVGTIQAVGAGLMMWLKLK